MHTANTYPLYTSTGLVIGFTVSQETSMKSRQLVSPDQRALLSWIPCVKPPVTLGGIKMYDLTHLNELVNRTVDGDPVRLLGTITRGKKDISDWLTDSPSGQHQTLTVKQDTREVLGDYDAVISYFAWVVNDHDYVLELNEAFSQLVSHPSFEME
jgi:hypothetical protein